MRSPAWPHSRPMSSSVPARWDGTPRPGARSRGWRAARRWRPCGRAAARAARAGPGTGGADVRGAALQRRGQHLARPGAGRRRPRRHVGGARSLADLQAAVAALQLVYARAGYRAVRTFLPEQQVASGTVRIGVSSRGCARSRSTVRATSTRRGSGGRCRRCARVRRRTPTTWRARSRWPTTTRRGGSASTCAASRRGRSTRPSRWRRTGRGGSARCSTTPAPPTPARPASAPSSSMPMSPSATTWRRCST